jgi:hypothetical protein
MSSLGRFAGQGYHASGGSSPPTFLASVVVSKAEGIGKGTEDDEAGDTAGLDEFED